MTVASDPHRTEPEILFEEARRRQRRRRVAAAWLLALTAGAALVGGLAAGGHSPSPPRPQRAAAGSGSPPAATWQELSAPGGYIPPGAIVTDVVRWRGALYASSQGSGSVRVPASSGCVPGNDCAVVWRSADGRRWHAVYAAPSLGSGQGEWLEPMRSALLLVDADEFSGLWRTANGRTWRALKLPSGLAGGGVSGTAADAGRRVVLVGNGISLPPQGRHASLVWTANSGLRLRPAELPPGYTVFYLERVRRGFLAVAARNQSGTPSVLLRSATGLRWHIAGAIRLPHTWADAQQSLVIAGETMVLALSPPPIGPSARAQLWYSANGRTWRRASVQGRLPLAGGLRYAPGSFPEVLAVDGGLLLYDSSNTAFWWSADGRAWRRLHVRGAPPANLAPQGLQGLDVVGNALIAIEQATRAGHGLPAGAMTFWRLDLGRR
ncbi:MAG: hypothetical protein M0T77_15430 [Actinomycetota bacterium]|nr:hypothetical protein [Actinomycetota bacterium]